LEFICIAPIDPAEPLALALGTQLLRPALQFKMHLGLDALHLLPSEGSEAEDSAHAEVWVMRQILLQTAPKIRSRAYLEAMGPVVRELDRREFLPQRQPENPTGSCRCIIRCFLICQ